MIELETSKLAIKMRSWVFKLLRIFMSHTSDKNEVYKSLSLVRSLTFAFVVTLVFVVTDLINGQLLFVGYNLGVILVFYASFYLSIKGFFDEAKLTLLLFASTLHFLSSASQTREAGNIMIYFPLYCSVFLFFGLHKKVQVILLVLFFSIQIAVLEYYEYSLIEPPHTISKTQIETNYLLSMIASIVLCLLFVTEFTLINRKAHARLGVLNTQLKKRNQHLQKSNAELDHFVNKASHDMRAPLRSILGLTQLMKADKNAGNLPDYVDLLEKATRKLDAYVLEVLEISKNAKSGLNVQCIDIEEFVWDIYGKLQYMMADRKVDFDFDCKGKEFYSDKNRLELVISNLIANSIKYSKPDNTIICKIQLQVVIASREAIFTIIDNGQGIAEDAIPKIFDMFYRANVGSDGSGLGLYLVKETVEKLGGTVSLTSTLGLGTTVIVRLPNLH